MQCAQQCQDECMVLCNGRKLGLIVKSSMSSPTKSGLGLYYAPKVSQIVAQFVNSFFWQIVANPKGYTIYNDE